MIPGRINGQPSGENWVGLIDGTYAIILTLLVIELPLIVLDLIKECNQHSHSYAEVAIGVGSLLLGYFAVFTILYDIWSYHKTLLRDAVQLRLFAICSSWLMFIASLVPPFYYLVNHYSVKLLLHYSNYPLLADRGLTAARTFVYILIALLYWILAFLARREQFQRQQSPQKRRELFLITGTAMSKCILTTVMMLITEFWHIPPPTPTLLLAISTYFYFNFFGFSRQRG
jgi:uncharacterized membrane protein